MSALHWSSENLRKHLRAVSGMYDANLQKNGMDPNKMRHTFYTFFNKNYDTLTPNTNLQKYLKAIELEYKNYVIYDICKSTLTTIEGWTDSEKEDYFLLIGKNNNDEFITRDIIKTMTVGLNIPDDVSKVTEQWTISSAKKADFVDITLKYHHITVCICQNWSYTQVLRHMRSMENT